MKISLRITVALVAALAFASNIEVARGSEVAAYSNTLVAEATSASTYDVPDANTSDLEADDHSSPWSGDEVHEEDGELEPGNEEDGEDEESSKEGTYDLPVREIVPATEPQALTGANFVVGRNLRTV